MISTLLFTWLAWVGVGDLPRKPYELPRTTWVELGQRFTRGRRRW